MQPVTFFCKLFGVGLVSIGIGVRGVKILKSRAIKNKFNKRDNSIIKR